MTTPKTKRFTTRMDIRKKIVEILKGNTAAGENVFDSFKRPSQAYEWPAIFVYPNEEDYTKILQVPLVHRRDLSITVEIIATDLDRENLTDQLDTISGQVEDIIKASNDLGELVHEIAPDSAEGMFSLAGPQPEGVWAMRFLVTYVKKP
jgi:HSP20 family molecular chaperone IbpA